MIPMHPNDAIAFIGKNSNPIWAIINFPDTAKDGGECWRLFITDEIEGNAWHQVFDHDFPRLDRVIRWMYENSLPVSTIPISINDWDKEE